MYNGVPLLGTYQKDVVTRMARWVVGVEITRCAFFHMQITYMKVYVCSFEARRSDVFIGKLSQCAHTHSLYGLHIPTNPVCRQHT